jgi:glucokinase
VECIYRNPPNGALTAQADAARDGERVAVNDMERAGRMLGIAIAGVCATLAPELTVIGGGGAGAFDLLRPYIESELAERARVIVPCRLASAAGGVYAGAAGAAIWGREW